MTVVAGLNERDQKTVGRMIACLRDAEDPLKVLATLCSIYAEHWDYVCGYLDKNKAPSKLVQELEAIPTPHE